MVNYNKDANSLFIKLCIIIFIGFVHFLFDNSKQMSPVWTAPFFSAAANLEWGKGFRINEEDILYYKSLSLKEQEKYHFVRSENLKNYNHNPIGYVYLIFFAKKIFFWMGDVKAIEALQILCHIIITISLINSYSKITEIFIVILLIGINPLIIYFTTFPFYYYWQVIPAALVLLYLIHSQFKFKIWIIPLSVILSFIFITRPSVLFILILILGLIFYRESVYYSIASIIICICCIFLFQIPTKKNPWFTMYVGIGAYPNSYIIGLSDNNGYALYKKYTGTDIYASIGGNYYNDITIDEFTEITKLEYLSILKSNPFLIIRNAILNFFQSFSLGYFVDYPLWVSYLSSLLGFILFTLLLLKRHFLWIAAIALNTLSFTPYYPPIQSYMFGSYILIVGAVIQLLNDFGFIQRLEEKLQQLKLKHFSLFKSA